MARATKLPLAQQSLGEIVAAELAAAKTEADVVAVEVRHQAALNKLLHDAWLPIKAAIDERRTQLGQPT